MKEAFPALARAFFAKFGLARHHIDSFNTFLDEGLQRVVDEVKAIEPLVIPPGYESYRLLFGRIKYELPVVREADGSRTRLTPMIARLRELTYAAPLKLEIIPERDGVPGEAVWAEIGLLPVMVKSKACVLYGATKEELVEMGEDPYDPGGYFIINGTERVLMSIEDLIPNLPLVEKAPSGSTAEEVARLFSEVPGFRIPHLIERMPDGVIYVSWARVPRIPLAVVMKALGVKTDQEIAMLISEDPEFMEDLMVILETTEGVETQEDALDYIGKKLKIGQNRAYRVERAARIVDAYLLPHLGRNPAARYEKARFLGLVAERLIKFHYGHVPEDDKDHYANKRLKLAGHLMEQLFRAAFRTLVNDMQYSFERVVKRGKEPSPAIIVRSQLLTSRIESAMSTGYWIGGRTGVTQHLQRLNFYDTLSHLRRVMSPLASSQPHFEARALHPTHWGKLCVAETPEGSNIGLRKNLAIFAKLSYDLPEEDVKNLVLNLLSEVEKGEN